MTAKAMADALRGVQGPQGSPGLPPQGVAPMGGPVPPSQTGGPVAPVGGQLQPQVSAPAAPTQRYTPQQIEALVMNPNPQVQTFGRFLAAEEEKRAKMAQAEAHFQGVSGGEQAKLKQGEEHFRGVSGSAALADARARSEGALNRASHFTIAGIDQQGRPLNAGNTEAVDLAKVSPVDLEAAHRYNADGTLPPNMGRGQQGMMESRRIRSIAAQLSQFAGIDPADARANQLAFKASGAAITQLAKREAQIGSNVRNFDFNANQVQALSQKVDRTGVPIVNAWINAGRRAVSGNPELSAFDVAVKTTVNEFAQIVSGTTAGATTEGEKQKAEKLLSAAQTPQQINAVIQQMRIESQNRMKSFADEKQARLASMRTGVKPPEPAKVIDFNSLPK